MRWAGAKLALIRPYQLIAADVGIEVSLEEKLIFTVYNFITEYHAECSLTGSVCERPVD